MDFDWNAALNHPLTQIGAGMMVGADPRGQNLGGVGQGLMNAQRGLMQQQELEQQAASQRENAQWKQFQMEQARAKMAAEADRAQKLEDYSNAPPEVRRQMGASLFPEIDYRSLIAPVKVSSAMRKYQEAGGQQGTGMAFGDFLKSPAMQRGTTVNVGGAVKPTNIPGFALVPDPNEATGWRYEKVGGAPEKGMTLDQRTAANFDKEADFALAGLDRVSSLLDEYGTEPAPGGGRAPMEAALERAILTVKDVLGMGALQGEERAMLERLIGDPTEALAGVKGANSYRAKLAEAKRMIEDKRRIYGTRTKGATGSGPTAPPPGFVLEE